MIYSGQVISHKDFKSREDFDEALHANLSSADIDIVCLAGFMRILTGLLDFIVICVDFC